MGLLGFEIPDVDLDVADRKKAVGLFEGAVVASQFNHEKTALVPHNTGIYFQGVPTDPINTLATLPYDMAEEVGYYKIDLIPYHVYEGVKSEGHLQKMIDFAESDRFPWEWFTQDQFFTNTDSSLQVTHLGNHFETVQMYPPESVEDVAALIALIRPRKKYLIGKHWDEIEDKIWKKLPEEESDKKGAYFFKKSHAVAFALVILVHMQLLHENFSQT